MVAQVLVNGMAGLKSGCMLVHGKQVEGQVLTWGVW